MPTNEGQDRAESGSPEPPVEADRPPTPGHLSDSAEADTPEEQAGRFQFSLRWLLGFTTAVAIFFSLASWSGLGPLEFLSAVYLVALLFAPMTVALATLLWPGSLDQRTRKRVALIVSLLLLLPVVLLLLVNPYTWHFPIMLVVGAVLLLWLRRCLLARRPPKLRQSLDSEHIRSEGRGRRPPRSRGG